MEAGKLIVDFEVYNSYNPQTLIVGDHSYWKNAENLPAYLLVTPPGSKTPISNIFKKHRLNIFQSVNLGLSCLTECEEQKYEDLNDGIWTFVLKSGYEGFEKTRYYLKTDRIRLQLDQVYIKAGLEYSKEDKQLRNDLSDIEFLLRTAEARTRDGDWYKASRDFEEAKTILKRYQKCKDCL